MDYFMTVYCACLAYCMNILSMFGLLYEYILCICCVLYNYELCILCVLYNYELFFLFFCKLHL
jgi:hypothetical protein